MMRIDKKKKLQDLRYALTGASGYVGRRLLAQLEEIGAPVSVLVREPAADDFKVASNHRVVVGDLSDIEALIELTADADVVFHLAAYVHKPTHTQEQRAQCFEVNYAGTKRLLEACLSAENLPFVVLFSTVSVYGKIDQPFREDMECRPETAYGEAKLLAEKYFLELQKSSELKGCILRPSAIIGAGAPGNLLQLVKLLKLGIFPYFNGGKNQKSLTHVENILDGAMLAVKKLGISSGQVYNLSNEEKLPLIDIGKTLAAGLGKKPLLINLPKKPFLWAGSVLDWGMQLLKINARSFLRRVEVYASEDVVSTNKITAELGYQPKVSVEEALTRMAAAYRE